MKWSEMLESCRWLELLVDKLFVLFLVIVVGDISGRGGLFRVHILLFLFVYLFIYCCARYWTQGLAHGRQLFYHLAMLVFFLFLSLNLTNILGGSSNSWFCYLYLLSNWDSSSAPWGHALKWLSKLQFLWISKHRCYSIMDFIYFFNFKVYI
jgi:hypothetical protein